MKAELRIDLDASRSRVDPRLFGSFVEHLGRAVYGGIYEPDHPTADDAGFRQDVMELVRALQVPIVRYPGGNFVSGYDWRDGIGPRESRPRRLDLAWASLEPNLVGVHEFSDWAERVGAQVMMAVNLGTAGAKEAAELLEYCNHPGGTTLSDLRRKNGREKPFAIRNWCLGNEMDGPWQICHKTAEEYGRLAAETAKLLKWVDPTVELTVCGSSSAEMPTFGTWEREVLRHTYPYADYISLHNYYGNRSGNTPEYLACSLEMDRFITQVAAICDEIKAETGSEKTMMLSFDEWNVWFHSNDQDKKVERWQAAPPLLEDVYTFEDALVVGCLLITLLRHADRVKMACLAQLVNVIAPIMTETGGRCWAQTIYYPFAHASQFGRGTVLSTAVECPAYDGGKYGQTPFLETVAVQDETEDALTVFAVNRSLTEEIVLNETFAPGGVWRKESHQVLVCDDLQAINTADDPDRVKPRLLPPAETTLLPPASWNVIRYRR